MKQKKKINLHLVLIFIMAFLLGVILGMPELSLIRDASQLKAAGLVELEPIDTKQTSKSVYVKGKGSHIEITNYVEFQFEIEGTQKTIWLPTLNTYGGNDSDLGKKAVKEKIVNYRYIFYTDENIYTSTKSESVKDFMKEKIGEGLVVPLLIIGLGFLVEIIRFVFSMSKLPSILQSDMGVCRHNSIIYTYLFLTILPVAILVVVGTIIQVISYESIETIIPLLLMCLIFIGFIVFIVLFMWNRVLIVTNDEIVFRDTFGKVFRYDSNEVKGYREKRGYRSRNLEIVTEYKKISIRADCVNCDEVMEYLQKYYHLVE